MSKSLEKLRAQRKLIQQHLEWLDEQIKDAEALGCAGDDAHLLVKPSGDTPVSANQYTPQTTGKSSAPSSTMTTNDAIEEPFIQYSSGTDIQRVKTGCIIFFAAITLLFLFFLFVFPYLLD